MPLLRRHCPTLCSALPTGAGRPRSRYQVLIRAIARLAAAALPFGLAGCGATAPSASAGALPPQPMWSLAAKRYQTQTFPASRPLIVITVATWCKYCAWEAKWQEPALITWASQHHLGIIVLDATPLLGIAAPGPLNDPAAGQDYQANPPASQAKFYAALDTTLIQYARRFHLPPADVYADPVNATYFSRHLQYYPTFYFVSAAGTVLRTTDQVATAASLEQTARDLKMVSP